MNIFVLDTSPKTAARYHCDAHVVKMILETTQLLSTAHWMRGTKGPYRPTHANHPCSVWVRESTANYKWLHELGLALCEEYTLRYDKIHACQDILTFDLAEVPARIPKGELTPFVLAMPNEYKIKGDPVASYRAYYKGDKTEGKLGKWTKLGLVPEWWK